MNKSKRTGTLTFHRALNFGSALQAYALQNYIIQKLHYENEIIDFIPDGQSEIYHFFIPNKNIRSLYSNIMRISTFRIFQNKKKSFSHFINNRLMLSEKVYTDENIVIEISDKYDWLIVGSDQIWNPICSDFSWTYLLEGISGNKISYSPSLGDSKFKGDEEQKFMNCLKNFSKVSVRELRAADHIKEASQFTINPEVLPDPTFLLDMSDYDKIVGERIIKEPYIFFYSVTFDQLLLNAVNEISRNYKLPVITVYTAGNSYRFHKNNIRMSKKESPEDFINLIKYADYVLTNSFHGIAFSIIYRKKFFYLGDFVKSDRIHNIFSQCQLESRGIDYKNGIPFDILRDEIDYSICNKALEYMQQQACEYLSTGLDLND